VTFLKVACQDGQFFEKRVCLQSQRSSAVFEFWVFN